MDTTGAGTSGSAGSVGAGEYDDMHRLVLQGMMSAGILDAKGVKKLFSAARSYLEVDVHGRIPMPYVQKVMRDINDKIKPFDMAIRSASCELTGEKYYMFLITVEKPLMKLQTLFSAFEIALLQKVIDTIFRKYPTFTVPFTECINLTSEVEVKGNITQAEVFLRKMLDTKYLTEFPLEGDEFNITVGIRGLRELEPLLRDCYGEFLANCCLCKSTLLHGLLCSNCHVAIHVHCYKRYLTDLQNVSAAALCPNPQCKVSWEDNSMIVRVRDTETFDYENNQAGGGSEESPATNMDVGQSPAADQEEEEDEDEPMPIVKKTRSQGSNKAKKRRRRKVDSSEESS